MRCELVIVRIILREKQILTKIREKGGGLEVFKEIVLEMYWMHYFVGGYSNKGFRIQVKQHESERMKLKGKTQREIGGNRYLIKVSGYKIYFN